LSALRPDHAAARPGRFTAQGRTVDRRPRHNGVVDHVAALLGLQRSRPGRAERDRADRGHRRRRFRSTRAERLLGGPTRTAGRGAGTADGPVRLMGVVGDDFRASDLERLRAKGIDLAGVEHAKGRSFRWLGRYNHDLATAETINTDLGVFGDWVPTVPPAFVDSEFVFLA